MGGLYYNLVLRNNDATNKDSEKLYYRVLKNKGVADQETLASYLSQISGVQNALCLAVLSKLRVVVTNFLKGRQNVEIPYLGSFNLMVNSSGIEALDETKTSQIKSISLRFSSKEEADLTLSHYTPTRSVPMTNTNDVIREKDPSSEIVDDPTA